MRVSESHPSRAATNQHPPPLQYPFFKDGKLIKHNNPHLEFSGCISITFKMQKKDKKNNTVT
jgi:hypothetical protein